MRYAAAEVHRNRPRQAYCLVATASVKLSDAAMACVELSSQEENWDSLYTSSAFRRRIEDVANFLDRLNAMEIDQKRVSQDARTDFNLISSTNIYGATAAAGQFQ
ncbi:MAG: hypothetical protein ABJL72_12470 [Roseobacter sp.]